MTFKALDNQKGFLGYFRITFFVVLLQAFWALFLFSPRAFQTLSDEPVTEFWICMGVLLVLFVGTLVLFFNPDFKLINGTVMEFTIDGEHLIIITAAFKILPFINRPPCKLTLRMREFSRDKINYPARIFPGLKFNCWELRTDDTSVYIIKRFFTEEAIAELEKFLYWKSLVAQGT
jgi:hypothetical protein